MTFLLLGVIIDALWKIKLAGCVTSGGRGSMHKKWQPPPLR